MRRCLAALAVFALGLATGVPASAEQASVRLRDSYVTPDFWVLVTGDSAKWTNEGLLAHTVTSYPDAPVQFDSSPETTDTCEPDDGGLLGGGRVESDCIQPGESFPHTFKTVGTYDFYCKIHGNPAKRPKPAANAAAQPCGMCGRIIVKVPSSARPATERPDPQPTATTSSDEEPSASPSASSSPKASASVVAGSPVADPGAGGGSAAAQVLLAAAALTVLLGLGYAVWRRYFQTA